jgi:hypothetical protein
MSKQGECTRQDLVSIWRSLFPAGAPEEGYELFEEIFLNGASPDLGGAKLALRPGGWTIKVSEGVMKGSITAALLGSILALAGFPALPTLVLPAIFPILFELEKVRLTVKEKEVLAVLTLRDEARSGQHPPEQLYVLLPVEMRQQLSPLDFADFLEKCRRAGLAEQSPDKRMTLRPPEQAKFRVTIL